MDDVVQALDEKKAHSIKVLDLRRVASYTDVLVICTGTSSTHVQSLVDNVEKKVKESPAYHNRLTAEGWCVLDYVDVVVHVFSEDARAYYSLESLWADAVEINPAAVVADPPNKKARPRKGRASSK